MRRPILQDPLARSAKWSRNIAVFALAVAVIGVLLSRKGLDAKPALAIEGGALAMAALAAAFSVAAMAVIWVTGFRGIGLALIGLLLPLALFGYPAYLAVEARTAPMLADVSTSLDDPPAFLATAAALAARHGATPPAIIGRVEIALQKRLYPDLATLDLDAEVGDVAELVRKLVKRRGWTLVGEVPAANGGAGHVDVVIKPALMGFPTDLTIRLRPVGERTRVDIRSVARTPYQEQPGANAARVQALAADIEDNFDES